QLDSAAWAYRELARLVPDNYRPWQELGRIEQQLGKRASARAAYQKSVLIDSSRANVISMAGLGEIYAQQGPADSASYYFAKALRADPSNELVHMLAISHFIEQDSLPAALTHSVRLAQIAPDNKHVRRRLGLIYLDLDSLQQADSVFTDLIDSGDRNWFNYSYLGEIDLRQDKFSDAVRQFEKAIKRNDTVAGLWLNKGLALRNLDNDDAAIDTYREGLTSVSNPAGRSALLFNMAVIYEQSDKIDSSIQSFESLLEIDPDNAQALNYLGYMLADRNMRLDYARQLIERAVGFQPNNAAFLDSYGWVHYRLGNYDEAIKYLEQAVQLDSDAVIFDHLGDAYHAVGDSDLARQWWQRALELEPDNDAIREKINR
ncbi:tetratricopeptide repeat protein, partial [candidate division GN15 bacterium]|nr:tetratricopeptide repeat protein [candidate division GN15 bacterium]